MKKNGILITIFIYLLVFTYLVKEKRILSNDQLLPSEVIDQLQVIELKNDRLELNNNIWIINSYQLEASLEAVKHFLLILKELRIEDRLTAAESDQVIHKFSLRTEDKKIDFAIHSISPITGRIVLSMDKDFFLVSMNHFIKGVFKNDQALYANQINEFRTYLTSTDSFLKDNYISDELDNIKNITIKTGSPVKLNLVQNTTIPKILPGLDYSVSIKKTLKSYLELIETKQILKNDIKVQNKLSQIFADDLLWLTLFESNSSDNEVYLRDEKLGKTFLITKDSTQVFFTQAKDFWQQQIFKEERLEGLNKLSLVLKDKSKEFHFEVPSTQTFIIKSTDGTKPNTKTLTELFKILFALDDYKQAYKVSHVVSDITLKQGFKVNILDKKLYFWLGSSFIHVLDLSNSLLFTFVNSSQIITENTINQFGLDS